MRHSATARLAVMAVLAIGLLIPLTWVYTIVAERSSRRNEALTEVSGTWGGPQVLGGAVLAVPYSVSWTDTGGRLQRAAHHVFFVPRILHVDGQVAGETRRRGIFRVPVYRATIKITGTFVQPLSSAMPPAERVEWEHATLQIGIRYPRGIVRRATLSWRGQSIPLTGGAIDVGLFSTGLHAELPALDPQTRTDLPFELTLDVNGTRDLQVLPNADETTVSIASAWPHPSFSGAPLPETRRVDASGFAAQWRVQDFGRTYPATWTTQSMNRDDLVARASASAFGVALIEPVDIYQQAERAVKYAFLFIVLTFLVFFLWEVLGAASLHPMQYTFVGFAMCVFYMLLISISEHAGFDAAYAISASVTTLLIGGYATSVLGGLRKGASVVGALTGLYGFLYLLLRLEDYALLAGSIGLFVILTFVMFITRGMNWYDLRLGRGEA
jgi:inner membrane protein